MTTEARQETKAYQTWVASWNAAYHDYGLRGDAIIAKIGAEPTRHELTDDEKIARDFPHAAAAQARYEEVQYAIEHDDAEHDFLNEQVGDGWVL